MNSNLVIFDGEFPVNVTPRIEEDGSLFFFDQADDADRKGKGYCNWRCALPGRDAAMIALNMLNGSPWFAASALHALNRRVAGFILANAETILARRYGYNR